MNETLRVLKERRSVRSYRPETLPEETLDAIIEAGLFAPSAKGSQSAVMVVVRDRETREYLAAKNAAIMGTPSADPFYGAPEAIVVLADPEATGEYNAICDGALVMGNLMNAAASLNVASCWINRAREFFAGDEGKALLKKWGLPERMIGIAICILGCAAGDPPAPKPRKDGRVLHI